MSSLRTTVSMVDLDFAQAATGGLATSIPTSCTLEDNMDSIVGFASGLPSGVLDAHLSPAPHKYARSAAKKSADVYSMVQCNGGGVNTYGLGSSCGNSLGSSLGSAL